MGNTLKIWKIGKYWEIRLLLKDQLYIFLYFSLKRIFVNFTGFIMLLYPLRFAINEIHRYTV